MAESFWPDLLTTVAAGQELSRSQAQAAMTEVLTGAVSDARLAGMLMGLRARGEAPSEVAAFAQVLLAHVVRVELADLALPAILSAGQPCRSATVVDIAGTGGDGANTANISTTAAFVVAACGVPVLKHGNRAVSSRAGAFDLIEALGIAVAETPAALRGDLQRHGCALCFAPHFHPALRHAGQVRRELGVRTVFNTLGPLVNPGQPPGSVLGAASPQQAAAMAGVLADQGRTGLVVCSHDGLDEFSPEAPTGTWTVIGGEVTVAEVTPDSLGRSPRPAAGLRGGTPANNADITRAVLQPGNRHPSGGGWGDTDIDTVREVVAVTAAAALAVASAIDEGETTGTGLLARIPLSIPLAWEALTTGRAAAVLAAMGPARDAGGINQRG